MTTEQLIQRLTERLAPVPSRAIDTRMALLVTAGIALTLLCVLLGFGARADLAQALLTFPFWLKWAYAGLLCGLASVMTLRLARPGAKPLSPWWISIPVGALAILAALELKHSPISHWRELWLGHSALYCPERIALLSIPNTAGIFIALRNLAPTRLRSTGATAALAAGACAAVLYGLACDEVSGVFVLTWYSLGIGLSAAIGALIGPWFLRW
jgi:hypothetical protein